MRGYWQSGSVNILGSLREELFSIMACLMVAMFSFILRSLLNARLSNLSISIKLSNSPSEMPNVIIETLSRPFSIKRTEPNGCSRSELPISSGSPK